MMAENTGSGFRRYLRELSDFRRFRKLSLREKQVVVYAETGSQWQYFGPIVDRLVEEHGLAVDYLTSSETDTKLADPPPGVRSYCIGAGTVRTIAFATLEAKVALMTTPGLETTYIKRSKHPVHYVYTPHNMNSTHMVFPRGALNGFDSILCCLTSAPLGQIEAFA